MTSDSSPETSPQPGARALASRRNGARSCGPKTVAGLARSSRNALKHGLRARRHVLLADEDAAEYRAFQAAARAELAPAAARRSGATSVVAPGSQARKPSSRRASSPPSGGRGADRLEAALLGRHLGTAEHAGAAQEALGVERIRDGHGPRALETLVRYRGSVLAELFRALAALEALRTRARAIPHAAPALLEPTGANNQTNPRSCAETGT